MQRYSTHATPHSTQHQNKSEQHAPSSGGTQPKVKARHAACACRAFTRPQTTTRSIQRTYAIAPFGVRWAHRFARFPSHAAFAAGTRVSPKPQQTTLRDRQPERRAARETPVRAASSTHSMSAAGCAAELGIRGAKHTSHKTSNAGVCCSPACALCSWLYDCQRWCQPRAATCMLLHRRRDRRATVLHTARPSMPAYAQVTALVSNVDIAPTLIDLAGALCRPLPPLALTDRAPPRVVYMGKRECHVAHGASASHTTYHARCTSTVAVRRAVHGTGPPGAAAPSSLDGISLLASINGSASPSRPIFVELNKDRAVVTSRQGQRSGPRGLPTATCTTPVTDGSSLVVLGNERAA
jgi:hypothetical protein